MRSRTALGCAAFGALFVTLGISACGSDDGGTAANTGGGGTSADASSGGGAGAIGGSGGSGGGLDVGCGTGTKTCTGSVAHDCGTAPSTGTDCSSEGKQCLPGLGCVVCTPGPVSCTTDLAVHCKSDGSALIEFACDPAMGLACNGKACVGPCSPSVIEDSYIGCEYYPTSVLNNVNNSYDFEVAVANASATESAKVLVSGGALTTPLTVTVPSGKVERIALPWHTSVKVCNETSLGNAFDQVNACSAAHNPDYSSRVVSGGAYRLLSDRPVAVYQFAPIQSTKSGAQAGTTEASLLIPQTAMGKAHHVATFGQGFARGAIAVVATLAGTQIEITPAVAVTAAPGYPTGIAAGQKATFSAGRGDVVELIATTAGSSTNDGDLTGSVVTSNHPVQVFGVHGCSWVINTASCDHLEDVMLPDVTLGTEYAVKSMAYNGASAYLVRVLALEDATNVSFDPTSVSPAKNLKKGELVDISAANVAVVIKSDRRIMVAGLNQGDNTLAAVVPTARYRKDYLFLAPDFQHNYAKIIAPVSASVTLDGAVVPATSFTAIGSTSWAWAIVPITAGPHRATSTAAFGVSVFGNQEAGFTPGGLPSAYELPGGLDLHETHVPPVPK